MNQKVKLIAFTFSFLTLVSVFILNLYMMWFASTSSSYSITQTFEQYQAINNWNLPVYADGLIDGDNEIDLVFNDGCIYLSQAKTNTQLHSSDCELKNPAFRTAANEGLKIGGQKIFKGLSKDKPSFAVIHSFIAKKPNENWKVFEQINGNVTVHELKPDGQIVELRPNIKDRVDAFWYFITHLFSLAITYL